MLSNKEAWELLREVAGDCVENADLHETAKEVAKECGGQQIAILALGKALAKTEKPVWEDALLQLKKSTETLEKVQSSITLSYNLLGTRFPKAQPLLLLCSLFQKDENIPIEELVKYSIGLKLFDEDLTLEEARNRVFALVNHLKSRNLLLNCGDNGKNDDLCVKMHDIVREVCLLIASGEQHSYFVRHESKLESWPHDNGLKNPIAISIVSDVIDELPTGLDYPNLRLFQLKLNGECIKIPGDFFGGMKELRVFKYEGYREKYMRKKRSLVPLPASIQFLTSLRVLSLEFCKVEGDISLIGSLKGLEILSFFKSQLDELPSEVRELCNLKLLDLRCDNSDLKIGNSVLSSLEKLEVLYMGNYESWINNDENGETNTSITELESLSCLTDLQIKVPNSMILLELNEFFFEKLKRFQISIDFGSCSSGKNGITKNSLCLGDVDLGLFSDTKLHSIVSRTQSLEMEGCEKGDFIIDGSDLARGVLENMESLVIEELTNLIEICKDGKIPDGCFHRLQNLRLAMLPSLTRLWKGPIHLPSLVNLRVVDITDCESIKGLFSPSVAKCLVQLEELKIGFCFELEGVIFSEGSEEKDGIGIIQFQKLNYLSLDRLPKLNSFYLESRDEDLEDEDLEEDESCTVQPLFSEMVMFPSLDKMEIQDLNSLEQILNSQLQEGPATKLRSLTVVNCEKLINLVNSNAMFPNVEELYIDNCETMESVFDLDGLSPFIANKLESLRLIELASLTHVWKNVSRDIGCFWNLKTIDIYDCEELRYLFSVSIAKMLVNLEVLNLSLCNGMKSVIEGDEENGDGELELEEGKIVFCQLKVIRLESLGRLTSFCSRKIDLELPLLDNVKIRGCYKMEIFSGGEVNTPKLEEPVDDSDGKLWIWEGNLNNGVYKG